MRRVYPVHHLCSVLTEQAVCVLYRLSWRSSHTHRSRFPYSDASIERSELYQIRDLGYSEYFFQVWCCVQLTTMLMFRLDKNVSLPIEGLLRNPTHYRLQIACTYLLQKLQRCSDRL